MQIVSNGDNLHEMSKPVFWEKQEINYQLMGLVLSKTGAALKMKTGSRICIPFIALAEIM